MSSVVCPACQGRLKVSPLGRWYAKFKCGHCGAPLQFDRLTNVLGVSGAVLFAVVIAFLAVHGYDALGRKILAIAGCVWLALMFLSYQFRRVIHDKP